MSEVHRINPAGEQPVLAAIEAEQMVLGLMMLNSAAISPVIQKGGARLFCDPVHVDIMSHIERLYSENKLVSPVTMAAAMRESQGLKELGGTKYLARISGFSAPIDALRPYIDMLDEWRAKRDIASAISQANLDLVRGDEPASEIAGRLESALVAAEPQAHTGPVSMLSAVTGAMGQILAAHNGHEGGSVKTGIGRLDDILGAMFPGDLVYLGGRPSMGKTALALSIALNVARRGHQVAIASLEMTPDAMAMRALSEQTARQGRAVDYASMRNGSMSDIHVNSLREAAQPVANLPISFLPRQYNDIGALSAGVKQIARATELRLVVVDYLQLMRSHVRGNTNEQVSDISKSLKALAMQLNVPILALSQLSRAVEQREDKRPVLSDLRDSGSIEQDADTVMFCYRDEYYLAREEPPQDDFETHAVWQSAMERCHNRLEIIVPKQRAGTIGTARVRCNPALNLIWED